MTTVEIFSGICGFTTIVTSENKGDYKALITIKSECPNWTKVNEILSEKEINVMTELFKDKKTGIVNSQVIQTALSKIPHVSCPVISGVLKAMEVSVGLTVLQPEDTTNKHFKENTLYPVNLPSTEAVESIKITLAAIMKPARQYLSPLSESTITPTAVKLLYLPFESKSHELFHPKLGAGINKNSLKLSGSL